MKSDGKDEFVTSWAMIIIVLEYRHGHAITFRIWMTSAVGRKKKTKKFKNNNNNRSDSVAAVAIASKIEQKRNSIVTIKANV